MTAMKQYFLITFSFLFLFPLFGQDFPKGIINDSDGFTNIRKEPSINSEIVGKIIEGDYFSFQPDHNSNWWKVEYSGINGYVNKDKIISIEEKQKSISNFFVEYYESDPNNAEFGEGNNEKLFILTEKFPEIMLNAFCEQKKEIKIFLIKQFETPVHDLIDLQRIYTKMKNINSECVDRLSIMEALTVAGRKSGLKIK